MRMNKFRVPWIEILIVLTIFLIVARFIWARELLEFEHNFIRSLGFSPSVKYFVTVPIGLLVLYSYYESSARELAGTGKPVVRKGVFIFAGFSLVLAFLLILFAVGGSHA